MRNKGDQTPIGKYKLNGHELRGRRKDKAIKKLTESRVRRRNKIDLSQEFD